jgi:hypothetical protein
VRYELGFYIPEDGILHSHRHSNLESCNILISFKVIGRADCELLQVGFEIFRAVAKLEVSEECVFSYVEGRRISEAGKLT